MRVQTLKPGLLVSLRTSVSGGVSYTREDLGEERKAGGTEIAEWKTRRIIDDKEELDAATKARSDASYAIRAVCAKSAFGLLCPLELEAKLEIAIAEARDICEEHNRTARKSKVSINVLSGRIAETSEAAARAIGSELSDLLVDMRRGIADANPKQIRDAADKVRDIAPMLAPEVERTISAAVAEARTAARAIVKRIGDAGDKTAVRVSDLKTGVIEAAARFLSSDLEAMPLVASAPVSAPVLDLFPVDQVA